MSKKRTPTVERTVAGWQFVLPGAERITAPPAVSAAYTVENAQLVIPGAERISNRELLNRRMSAPITPRRGQKGLRGTALFGSAE